MFYHIGDCGHPKPPANGSLSNYTRTTEGANVTFQCNDGYYPPGEIVAVCISRRWSPLPEEHSCTLKCK